MGRGMMTWFITLIITFTLANTQAYISFFNKTEEEYSSRFHWRPTTEPPGTPPPYQQRQRPPILNLRAFGENEHWRQDNPYNTARPNPTTLPRINKAPPAFRHPGVWNPWTFSQQPRGYQGQLSPPRSASLIFRQDRPAIPLRHTPSPTTTTTTTTTVPPDYQDDLSYSDLIDYLDLEDLQKDYDISMEDLLKIVEEIERDYDLPLLNKTSSEDPKDTEKQDYPEELNYDWNEFTPPKETEYITEDYFSEDKEYNPERRDYSQYPEDQEQLYQPHETYHQPQDSYQPQQDFYQPNQDSYQPKQDSYQPKHDLYQPQQNSYKPQQDKFNSKQDSDQPEEDHTVYYEPEIFSQTRDVTAEHVVETKSPKVKNLEDIELDYQNDDTSEVTTVTPEVSTNNKQLQTDKPITVKSIVNHISTTKLTATVPTTTEKFITTQKVNNTQESQQTEINHNITHNRKHSIPSLQNIFSNVDVVSRKPFNIRTTRMPVIPRLEDLFLRTTHRSRPITKDRQPYLKVETTTKAEETTTSNKNKLSENTIKDERRPKPPDNSATTTKPTQKPSNINDALSKLDLTNVNEEELARLVYEYTHPEAVLEEQPKYVEQVTVTKLPKQVQDPFMILTPKYDKELKIQIETEMNKTTEKGSQVYPNNIPQILEEIEIISGGDVENKTTQSTIVAEIPDAENITNNISYKTQNHTLKTKVQFNPHNRPSSFGDILDELDPSTLNEDEIARLVEQYTNPHSHISSKEEETKEPKVIVTPKPSTKPTTTTQIIQTKRPPSITDMINQGQVETLSIADITKLVNQYTQPTEKKQNDTTSNNDATPKLKGIVFPKSTRRKPEHRRPKPWLRPPLIRASTVSTRKIEDTSKKLLPNLSPAESYAGGSAYRHPIPSTVEKATPNIRHRGSAIVSEYGGYGGRPIITSRRTTTSTSDPSLESPFSFDKSSVFGAFGINFKNPNETLFDGDDDIEDVDIVYEYEDIQDNTKSAIIASSVLGGLAVVFFIVLLFVCRWRQRAWRKLSKDRIPDSNSSLPTVSPKPNRKGESTQSGLWTLLRKSKRGSQRSNSITSADDPS